MELISWEITVGIITLVGGLISVMSVVVKVNGTMTRLEEAVRQLRDFIEDQDRRNERFVKTLASHETRLALLEKNNREEKK